MADLSSLIRLHKHELDEKQREISAMYEQLSKFEGQKRRLREQREEEIRLANESPEIVSYTLSGFLERSKQQEQETDACIFEITRQIEDMREIMLETFAELKKFELTHNERLRVEEQERKLKEGRMFDEIALDGFVRNQDQ